MGRGWLVVALVCASCFPVPEPPPTGSAQGQPSTSNAVEAAEFAGVAGLETVVEESAKTAARSDPPRRTYCPGDYEHDCSQGPAREPAQDEPRSGEEDMTPAEARSHALTYINGMRSLSGVGLVELDGSLDDFAQEGSQELARDHHAHAHIAQNRARCPGCAEIQGDPGGWRPEAVGEQIDEILAAMMAEGPGGGHHDILLGRAFGHVGVGIVNPGGRMYFTVDFAP